MDYNINKGIGKSVEFKGLKAHYVFIFVVGVIANIILFVILYSLGLNQFVCIGIGLVSASILVFLTYYLNNKYGEHGLMKLFAVKSHPYYLMNRKPVNKLFKKQIQ